MHATAAAVMAELASLHLCIGRLSLSASISWGTDDNTAERPLISPPDLIDTPELLEDETGLGFRAP